MNTKVVQRGIIAALVVAAIGAAIAVHLITSSRADSRRADHEAIARHGISAGVQHRAYFLEDVADMVGVHDDADIAEFSRYAHVRDLDEAGKHSAVVAIQWIRRSPSGELAPAGDVPKATRTAAPILVHAGNRADEALADAIMQRVARPVIRRASLKKRAAISVPVRLANGHAGFYLAVPIEAHRFSGDVSHLESRSAMVGLIDAQEMVNQSFDGRAAVALRLRDGATPLAAFGALPQESDRASVSLAGRQWTIRFDSGALSPPERALPWLIVALGLALALAVARLLGNAAQRRDGAIKEAKDAYDRLEDARAEAERRSREDPLTGIFNRRHFGEVLAIELRREESASGPAMLLLDLDHFKRVNDEYGHLVGDEVLRAASERLLSVLRESDCLARWGGEEFALLAPGLDSAGAAALGERARRALADAPIEVDDMQIQLTLSVGIALADGGRESADALIDAADQALYQAKSDGRNCVRVRDEAAQSAASGGSSAV